MEMMLTNMLRNLGIDPEAIMKVATDLSQAIEGIHTAQQTMLKQQRRIMRHLEISFEEVEENDDRNGSAGSDHGNSDAGSGERAA
jgi:uncharacterized protein YaaN involved in tellurite resistance